MYVSKTVRAGPASEISINTGMRSSAVSDITIFGKSWQQQAGTPAVPVQIESIADNGTLTMTVEADGSAVSAAAISVGGGLAGIQIFPGFYLKANGKYLLNHNGRRLKAEV